LCATAALTCMVLSSPDFGDDRYTSKRRLP
jgi:hypothetical protein